MKAGRGEKEWTYLHTEKHYMHFAFKQPRPISRLFTFLKDYVRDRGSIIPTKWGYWSSSQ